MRLTHRSEYAMLALIHMARVGEDKPLSVKAIADAKGISPGFLEQILLALRRAGLVRSCRGKGGGFRLARKPKDISVAQIIRTLDGALAPTESVSRYFYESTPIEKEEKLLRVFKDIRDYVSRKLERTTVADMCK